LYVIYLLALQHDVLEYQEAQPVLQSRCLEEREVIDNLHDAEQELGDVDLRLHNVIAGVIWAIKD
jgi:hypothetical protein